MSRVAFLDLEMVRRAYASEQEAMGHIKKLHYRGVSIIFLSDEKRSPDGEQWLKDHELDGYTRVHKEDTLTPLYSFTKRFLPDWKQSFVRSFLEDMDAGKIRPVMETIFVAFSDEKVRDGIASLGDRRVVVCSSLEEVAGKV
jgi:hypothetical protein